MSEAEKKADATKKKSTRRSENQRSMWLVFDKNSINDNGQIGSYVLTRNAAKVIDFQAKNPGAVVQNVSLAG